eukprot:Gb_22652 [translate_table: standard]
MEVRDLPSRSPSNINQSEDVGHRPTTQQIEEDSLVLHTSTDAKVDTHAALLSNPQTNQTLPQDANALSRCSDSLVGTAIDIDPSQEENAQCGSNATAGSCTSSEQLGSDDTHLEGEEIIAKGIASVLGPVMRDFDARAEGALKSQGVLASSIDRLTRELDKLLEDAPLPFITQHAAKLSGVRKRVLSLNSTLQVIQRRIDNIERMLSGQGEHLLTNLPNGQGI